MKREFVALCVLLVVAIVMLIVIIRQNQELLSQLHSTGNYLSEKLDNLTSFVKTVEG